jgi:hypothetical protein
VQITAVKPRVVADQLVVVIEAVELGNVVAVVAARDTVVIHASSGGLRRGRCSRGGPATSILMHELVVGLAGGHLVGKEGIPDHDTAESGLVLVLIHHSLCQ